MTRMNEDDEWAPIAMAMTVAVARVAAVCGGTRRKVLSEEVVAKIDYKNPQVLRSFVTDRGKMVPRRISGASARQQRVISTGGPPRAHARLPARLSRATGASPWPCRSF
jgi:ribosomal protein S18